MPCSISVPSFKANIVTDLVKKPLLSKDFPNDRSSKSYPYKQKKIVLCYWKLSKKLTLNSKLSELFIQIRKHYQYIYEVNFLIAALPAVALLLPKSLFLLLFLHFHVFLISFFLFSSLSCDFNAFFPSTFSYIWKSFLSFVLQMICLFNTIFSELTTPVKWILTLYFYVSKLNHLYLIYIVGSSYSPVYLQLQVFIRKPRIESVTSSKEQKSQLSKLHNYAYSQYSHPLSWVDLLRLVGGPTYMLTIPILLKTPRTLLSTRDNRNTRLLSSSFDWTQSRRIC